MKLVCRITSICINIGWGPECKCRGGIYRARSIEIETGAINRAPSMSPAMSTLFDR